MPRVHGDAVFPGHRTVLVAVLTSDVTIGMLASQVASTTRVDHDVDHVAAVVPGAACEAGIALKLLVIVH
jgi:hypothetical protein